MWNTTFLNKYDVPATHKKCFSNFINQKRGGTLFDLISVFSLVGKRVHNIVSIFVIGKGISKKLKKTVGMEHKVEKFLNYIGKYI